MKRDPAIGRKISAAKMGHAVSAEAREKIRASNMTRRAAMVGERILARIEPEPNSGCWLYTGKRVPYGYGVVQINGRYSSAHRVLYERLVGPVAAGLELDHLCRVPPCVNPQHLEPVTHAENLRRAQWPIRRSQTHCKRGHPLSGANIRIYYGKRHCVLCRQMRRA